MSWNQISSALNLLNRTFRYEFKKIILKALLKILISKFN